MGGDCACAQMSDTGLHTVRPLFTVSLALALGEKSQSTNTFGHHIGHRDLDCDPGRWDASAADAVCTNVNFDVTSE